MGAFDALNEGGISMSTTPRIDCPGRSCRCGSNGEQPGSDGGSMYFASSTTPPRSSETSRGETNSWPTLAAISTEKPSQLDGPPSLPPQGLNPSSRSLYVGFSTQSPLAV